MPPCCCCPITIACRPEAEDELPLQSRGELAGSAGPSVDGIAAVSPAAQLPPLLERARRRMPVTKRDEPMRVCAISVATRVHVLRFWCQQARSSSACWREVSAQGASSTGRERSRDKQSRMNI